MRQFINRVHILDMTCNLVTASECDTEVCEGYKINSSGITPNPDIAFGGKRKTRRKSKPKKTKRMKKKTNL